MTASAVDQVRRIASRLAATGVRFTAARRRVAEALARANGPASANDLHAHLGTGVPLSSLYRSLAVLGDAGVLDRSHDADGVARYELAEWLSGHHHHLVCTACGSVSDVRADPEFESLLAPTVVRVATDAGYEVTGHRVDIEGVCPRCR